MRLVILFVLLVAASPAMSRYQGVALEQVPVARLIENLEKISKENPNSAEAWLNLGRAHGMAYAQKTDPLTVPKVGQYSAAVRVGRIMEVHGPNSSVNSACASGSAGRSATTRRASRIASAQSSRRTSSAPAVAAYPSLKTR